MTLGIGEVMAPVAKGPLDAIGGTLSDAWQALLGDRVAAWRLKNAASLQQRIFDELAAKGLSLNTAKIPERYAFAWFEEATKQDEPEIQTLFARLLTRAAAGHADAGDRRHIETLGKFTPEDALAFETLFGPATRRQGIDGGPRLSWGLADALHRLDGPLGPGAGRSLEHLIALGVIASEYELNTRHVGEVISAVVRGGTGTLTGLNTHALRGAITSSLHSTNAGRSLYRAIRDDQPPPGNANPGTL